MFSRNKKVRSEQERTDRTENISYTPGAFMEEAMAFLKKNMDEDVFTMVMNSQDEKAIPSVLARIYLNEDDWQKYIWIEKHGSLEGFKI